MHFEGLDSAGSIQYNFRVSGRKRKELQKVMLLFVANGPHTPHRLSGISHRFESQSRRALPQVSPHLSPNFLSVYCPMNKGIKVLKT